MRSYPFEVLAVYERSGEIQEAAFVEHVPAENVDEAIVMFWAGSANMVERRKMPLSSAEIMTCHVVGGRYVSGT